MGGNFPGGRFAIVAIAATAATLGFAGKAHAFCRTVTCPLDPSHDPTVEGCLPDPATCQSLSPPDPTNLVVWWRNACIGYSIQQGGSKQVPYATAVTMFEQAFGRWTSSLCPTDVAETPAASSATPVSTRVSIDVRNLGAVSCGKVQYNQSSGNQHVIIFYDEGWPYGLAETGAGGTLGLTTVTYDPNTGEIYDADMEINSTADPNDPGYVPLAITDPIPESGFDFQSIITHEAGHFLGMAHSDHDRATMYASYLPGTTYMRDLSSDDVAGLCSIYLPEGIRATGLGGADQTPEDACDPTPRHGFSTQCGSPPKGLCTLIGAPTTTLWGLSFVGLTLTGITGWRRNRRRAHAL